MSTKVAFARERLLKQLKVEIERSDSTETLLDCARSALLIVRDDEQVTNLLLEKLLQELGGPTDWRTNWLNARRLHNLAQVFEAIERLTKR